MVPGDSVRVSFVRDAALAAGLVALLLAPSVYSAGPDVLRVPGTLLYVPLLFLYVLIGGETEGPHGPGAVHLVLFAVVAGVCVATVTAFVRSRFDTAPLATWQFLAAALLAVGGTVGALVGLLSLAALYELGTAGTAVAVAGGLALLGAGVRLASRATGEA